MRRIKCAIHLDAFQRCFELAIRKFTRASADRAFGRARNIDALRRPQTAFTDLSFINQNVMHDLTVKPFSKLAQDNETQFSRSSMLHLASTVPEHTSFNMPQQR